MPVFNAAQYHLIFLRKCAFPGFTFSPGTIVHYFCSAYIVKEKLQKSFKNWLCELSF